MNMIYYEYLFMRIAFFTDDYLPHVHGVTTSIKNYREALEALGHEVYIIAPKQPGYEDHDDHIIRMPSLKNFAFENRPTSVIYPGLARKFDKYEFDIVHSHMQFYLGVLAHSVAKRQNIPHVTSVHTLYTEMLEDYPFMITAGLIAVSFGFPVVFKTKPILPFRSVKEIRQLKGEKVVTIMKQQGWRLCVEFANRTDACISPSRHLGELLVKNGMTVPCHIFPNSVDTARYRQAKASDSPIQKKAGEKYVVCVARLSLEKRQRTLIEAMKYVKHPDVKLVLAGGGPAEAELRQTAIELGVEDRVIFTGMVGANEVASLLKQADLFALASYHFDNQPMTLLEAAAAGTPVVYCDERLTEGLEGGNAVLASGIEGEDFAATIDDLLSNDEKRAEMAKAARKIAKEYDSNTMVKRLEALYLEMIDNMRS